MIEQLISSEMLQNAGSDEGIIHKGWVVYMGERNLQVNGRAIADPAALIDMGRCSVNILYCETITLIETKLD